MTAATLSWDPGYAVAHYYQGLEYVAAVVATIILLSSLDDLFIDAWYWGREILRRFTIQRLHKPLTSAQLYAHDQQPIAIMVPAWHEYDLGERLGKMGMLSIFARFPVQFATRRKSWFGLGKEREFMLTMPLCVREFFPDTFRTAYRRRARWTLGIGLQGWKQTGWSGSLANRYLLSRDRKGIVTAFVGILAYGLVLQFLLFSIASMSGVLPRLFASPFSDSKWLVFVLWANACALLLRVAQRIFFVTRLYGWEHGLLSVPRMVVANFINFMAVSRAWRLFIGHLVTGKRLAWDKTMHDFPSEDGLDIQRQRLGELLVSWQAIDANKLELAFNEGHAREAPLGRVLMAKGWLDEETLAEAIAFQSDLERGSLDPERLPRDVERLPLADIVRHRVLPQGEDHQGRAILLSANAISDAPLAYLVTQLGQPVTQRIVREGDIATGIRLLRGVDVTGPAPIATETAEDLRARALPADGEADAIAPDAVPAYRRGVPLISDLLIELGHVTRASFEGALQSYRPDLHGLIGDYMVAREVISRAALENVIQEQHRLRGDEATR